MDDDVRIYAWGGIPIEDATPPRREPIDLPRPTVRRVRAWNNPDYAWYWVGLTFVFAFISIASALFAISV